MKCRKRPMRYRPVQYVFFYSKLLNTTHTWIKRNARHVRLQFNGKIGNHFPKTSFDMVSTVLNESNKFVINTQVQHTRIWMGKKRTSEMRTRGREKEKPREKNQGNNKLDIVTDFDSVHTRIASQLFSEKCTLRLQYWISTTDCRLLSTCGILFAFFLLSSPYSLFIGLHLAYKHWPICTSLGFN